MSKAKDIIGHKFGRLTVIKKVANKHPKKRTFLCECECGNALPVITDSLLSGNTKSCGCLRVEKFRVRSTTHGGSVNHPIEFRLWKGIRSRCNNPNDTGFHKYGERGIRVAEEWDDFAKFYSDMGDRPSNKHSIERVDNEGDYSSENCKWATLKEQSRNKRTNRHVTINGVTKLLCEWREELGVSRLHILKLED